MDLVGYILGGISAIAAIILTSVRGVDKAALDASKAIRQEFRSAYKELADTLATVHVDAAKVRTSVTRLTNLQLASSADLPVVRAAENAAIVAPKIAVVVVVLVALSIGIAQFAIPPDQRVAAFIFQVVFPFCLLIVETFFLGWIVRREGFLRRMAGKYESLEYRQ